MLDLARGPLLVAVADRPDAITRAAALDAAARAFDVVEARLDLFPAPALDDCADACARLEATGTPVIVTIRTAAQGGRFTGGDADRLPRFRAALAVASWADVEDDATIAGDVAAVTAARAGGQVIVSHHDFARTPPLDELLAIVDACHAVPGAIGKLATAVVADADRDALRAVLARRPARTCVIGMGASDAGLRIELAALGSLLAYGYLDRPTAPGQTSAAELHTRLVASSPGYAARRAAGARVI